MSLDIFTPPPPRGSPPKQKLCLCQCAVVPDSSRGPRVNVRQRVAPRVSSSQCVTSDELLFVNRFVRDTKTIITASDRSKNLTSTNIHATGRIEKYTVAAVGDFFLLLLPEIPRTE